MISPAGKDGRLLHGKSQLTVWFTSMKNYSAESIHEDKVFQALRFPYQGIKNAISPLQSKAITEAE